MKTIKGKELKVLIEQRASQLISEEVASSQSFRYLEPVYDYLLKNFRTISSEVHQSVITALLHNSRNLPEWMFQTLRSAEIGLDAQEFGDNKTDFSNKFSDNIRQ